MKTSTETRIAPTTQLGRAGRFLVFQYRLWAHCGRLLKKNHAAQVAAALSYYTIFGIVPLAIVVVLIFHTMPEYRQTGEQLKEFVYGELRLTQIEYPNPDKPEEHVVLTDYLDEIVDGFFANFDKSSLGLISTILVIWAALRLLSLIEGAFNRMWYVARGRRFVHRVVNYWALLTLVPLLLGTGLYVTTQYRLLESFQTGPWTAITPVVSYLLSLLTLFLLYLVMPNAKVQAGPALWAAAVAALVWSCAKWGFGAYVTELIPYSTVYGVLGLIPLGVFWIYVTWLIVLFGLQLAFATQHFKILEAAEIPKAEEAEGRFIANEMTAVAMAREVAAALENSEAPISTDDICGRLDIPGEFGQKLLNALTNHGLLARTSEPQRGYLLARAPRHIRLSDIAEAVSAASLAQPRPAQDDALYRVMQAKYELLSQYGLEDVLDSPPQPQRSPAPPEPAPTQPESSPTPPEPSPPPQPEPTPTTPEPSLLQSEPVLAPAEPVPSQSEPSPTPPEAAPPRPEPSPVPPELALLQPEPSSTSVEPSPTPPEPPPPEDEPPNERRPDPSEDRPPLLNLPSGTD
jgi:membrane protein